MKFTTNICSDLVVRLRRLSRKFRGSSAGFTATEIMMAVGVFSVIMAGTMGVYLSCQQAWHVITLDMRTSNEASIILEKMIHGVGGNSGIRSAIGGTVNIVSPGVDWSLSYESADNGTNFFQYIATEGTIVHSNSIAGMVVETLGEDIITSSIAGQNDGVNLAVSVAVDDGMFSSTNTFSTFVTYRN